MKTKCFVFFVLTMFISLFLIYPGIIAKTSISLSFYDIPLLVNSSFFCRSITFEKSLVNLPLSVSKTPISSILRASNLSLSIFESYPGFAYTMIILLSISLLAVASLTVVIILGFRSYKHKQSEQQIREENLKEKKESLERIINTAPISYMLALDGKVIDINEMMKENTGLNVGDVIQPIYAEPEQRNILMDRVMRQNIAQNEIMNIIFTDGKVHRALVNAAAWEYEHEPATVIWASDVEEQEIIKDTLISSRRETKETKERLEWIMQTASVGYMLVIDQKILEINDNMKKSLGLKEGDAITDFYPKVDNLKSFIDCFKHGEEIKNAITPVAFTNGETRRCLISTTLLKHYDYQAIVVWMVDVEQSEYRKDKLIAARKSLQTVINSLPAAIRITDVETAGIVYANEACYKMFGYDSLKDVPILSITPEIQNNGEPSDKKILSLLHSEMPLSMEIEYLNASGALLECRTSVCNIEYNGRKSVLAFITDLAKEKESEKLRQSLQRVLDMLPVAVRIINNETKILTYANKAAAEMFGVEDAKEYFGKSSYLFVPEHQTSGNDSEKVISNVEVTSKPSVTEIELCSPEGRRIHTLITSCLIDYNGTNSSVAIIQDLTREKELQQMLQNTAEKEKEANLLKSRFLINMSHEIRTPMNAIIGLTEIEQRKNVQNSANDIYQKINISAKNLLAIVNDILDLSKIEANKIELYSDELELEEVLNSALLVASPRLENKNVEFLLNVSMDLPRFVIGDRTRLWQILKNFLDNSAKYTENGKIVLTVYSDNEQSDDEKITIVFVIEDTGIGMNEEQMKKIFEPYEQIYSKAQRKYDGTGLGMVISKQLCDLMGGTLNIASEKDVGTIIHLNIPFKRSENKETNLTLAKSKVLSGINILSVDDEKLSLDIMKNLLQNSGAVCTSAQSGNEALKIILEKRDQNQTFDLILLDYMMEGMNGIETAKQIQLSLSKAPKLLMVTAYQKLLLKSELEKNGIENIIEKPFIPSHFLHKICCILGLEIENMHNSSKWFQKYADVNVLLCEDYPLNQEVASGMLAQFNITSTIAENGKKGIEALESGKSFDLIFMDLNMPVMDGYEAISIIRSRQEYNTVPIIVLTADAMKETEDLCMKIGMNDYLIKPIEFDKLHKLLQKWLPESKRIPDSGFEYETNPDNAVLARFGNDHERFEKALIEFGELLPSHWQNFSIAIKNEAELKSFVHKLKGAAGTLGEMEIYDAALAFENSLKNGKPCQDLYKRLVDASYHVKNIIAAKDTINTKTAESGKLSEFMTLVKNLKEALSEFDPQASSAAVKSLKEKKWPFIDSAQLNQLFELSEKYEFDSALTILKEISEVKE